MRCQPMNPEENLSVKIVGPEICKFSNKLKVGPASITIFRIPLK